jgi:hypothetical protein
VTDPAAAGSVLFFYHANCNWPQKLDHVLR